MAVKKRNYYSDTSKSKVKKTMSISAVTAAEFERVKSEAIAVGLGKLNLSEWYEDKIKELISEIDMDITDKKSEDQETKEHNSNI
jgi:hypothetical protein